jgi:tRNA pseudouridine38-40 synthase
MPTLKLLLEYDGTDLCGWQLQPEVRTVQGELEAALEKLVKHPVRVLGAGRTDAGVHALGQVASFSIPEELPDRAFRLGLNALLPPDIAVRGVERVPDDFHARHWSRGKRYRYTVSLLQDRSPLRRRVAWWPRREWDVERLRAAIPHLIGTHDFSSFRASGCQAKQPVRTLRKIELAQQGDELTLTFEGTAFLKQMVRNLVGTLGEVANGKRHPDEVRDILAARDRKVAGVTAPAQGLTLLEVFYGDGPPFRVESEHDEEDE